MRPKCEPEQPQREMLQIDLEQVIDLDHPLVRLGLSIDWSSLEETVGDTYHPSHVGRRLPMQSSRYAHAGQMKRAGACTRKLKTQLGRIVREIERQVETPSNKLRKLLRTAHRIHAQQRHDKNKVYSVHEPEVQCIAKGKQYEFDNKVSAAVSRRGGWLVGAESFTGNPYDGHTLAAQTKQVESLIANKVSEAHVDMGYRGHDYDGAVVVHVDKRGTGRTSEARRRWMKRRAAVEPGIGHLKSEHRLERNRLKGTDGNAINAILAAAAMNFQKLLRASWRIFLFCLMNAWNELLTLQGAQDCNTLLQYAGESLFQDRVFEDLVERTGRGSEQNRRSCLF